MILLIAPEFIAFHHVDKWKASHAAPRCRKLRLAIEGAIPQCPPEKSGQWA
jgi:hypothetical protein